MHKFLFEVTLSDGSMIQESSDDKSQSTEGKNAFYDVLQRMDDVKYFCLRDSCNHTLSIDLTSGQFELNGQVFGAQDPSFDLPPNTQRRLIYFRRVHQFLCTDGSSGTRIEYHCGWQATVEGKNHQITVSVT